MGTGDDMSLYRQIARDFVKGDSVQVNDIVIFSPRACETAEGIVTRVWDKPASDPYVTVRTTETDRPQTFTRFASALVKPVDALHDPYVGHGPRRYEGIA